MTAAQEKFYRRLWSRLRKAKGLASEDRHAQHLALGLPESHAKWNNGHFDKWKGHCLAAARPADLDGQVKQASMPETRVLVSLGHYLRALEKPEAWAVGIVRNMNEHGRIGQPWEEDRAYVRDGQGEKVFFDYAYVLDGEPRRKELGIADLNEMELQKVLVAVKKACKRRWRTKADLIEGIDVFSRSGGCLENAGAAARSVCQTLQWPAWPARGLEDLNYETLLCVLSALRNYVAGAATTPLVPF